MILAMRLRVDSTPQQMPNRKLTHKSVLLRTATGNTGDVYLANDYASANDAGFRYALPPIRGYAQLKLNNLSTLWYYGTLNDVLDIIAEVE